MRQFGLVLVFGITATLAGNTSLHAQQAERRAKAPEFNNTTTSIIFFKDVFAEALQGERPATLSENRQAAPAMAPGSPGGGMSSPAASGGGAAGEWADIISPTTIQDEVKRLNNQLTETVQNVRKFNGGGFEEARRDFTELAMIFEIIAEHDGDVRWKEFALSARDGFARAGFNSKVGTDNSFKEAKLRAEDLEQLVRGGSIEVREADPKATWDAIADRPPLMQRLEIAYQKRLKPMTASESEFKSNTEEILHEAEIIAAIGHAMQKEGFEYYDDDDYLTFSKQMQEAAMKVVKAVKENNADAARTAAGDVGQSCTLCHESYR
ncbi:Cytochrome C' [Bremerella volcania]|uniref:Cytochrome C n=1 Tax=Bremerella volcania TaxID=2527984 RepID=A0A518CCW5_9BACT|nr:cytochrome c [Bremerella volcania]QDU77034.1 Cytochrome C' [Bremerella volcania]